MLLIHPTHSPVINTPNTLTLISPLTTTGTPYGTSGMIYEAHLGDQSPSARDWSNHVNDRLVYPPYINNYS